MKVEKSLALPGFVYILVEILDRKIIEKAKTIIDTYQVKCDTPTRDIMDKIIDMVRNGKS